MKLKNMSEGVIKEFAGATIFGRGKEYFQSQMVEEIKYDASRDNIQAEVSGSSGGNYDVEITAARRGIEATCSCPYEGYPCKHIVAVLLAFSKKQGTFVQQAVENEKKTASLKERVRALSKERLTEILLSLIEKYPDCQRDLLIRMGDDPKETVGVILKQIHQIFRAFESDEYASIKVAKQLKSILQAISKSQIEIRTKVYWAISDRILRELNEYGMDDEPLEDMAMETLDLLDNVWPKSGISAEEKAGIIRSLEKYAKWGNCGIRDTINESIGRLTV